MTHADFRLLEVPLRDLDSGLEAVPGSDGVSPSLAYKRLVVQGPWWAAVRTSSHHVTIVIDRHVGVRKCDLENAQQLISPMAVPGVMWDMHKVGPWEPEGS